MTQFTMIKNNSD